MTYQSLVMTNGLQTFIVNLYGHTSKPWRPVYHVPTELQQYNAFSGILILSEKQESYQWQHQASGKWTESEYIEEEEEAVEDSIYRLEKVFCKLFLEKQLH